MGTTCAICLGAVPSGKEAAGHTALCASVVAEQLGIAMRYLRLMGGSGVAAASLRDSALREIENVTTQQGAPKAAPPVPTVAPTPVTHEVMIDVYIRDVANRMSGEDSTLCIDVSGAASKDEAIALLGERLSQLIGGVR